MGTNCALILVTRTLHKYELSFLQQLVAIHLSALLTNLHLLVCQSAQAFLVTRRFLDDLACINNPYLKRLLCMDQYYFHPEVTGIYPHTLLVSHADSGDSTNYKDKSRNSLTATAASNSAV